MRLFFMQCVPCVNVLLIICSGVSDVCPMREPWRRLASNRLSNRPAAACRNVCRGTLEIIVQAVLRSDWKHGILAVNKWSIMALP